MSIRLNGVDRETTINQETSTPMGTYVLADNPNLYQVQQTNHFEFIVEGLDGILRAGAIGTEQNGRLNNAKEVLRISVSQAFIPHFSQNPIEIKRGNSTIKAAGSPTFNGGEIVLNDYIGADTKAVLMAWQNLSYNVRTDKVGLMSDYKKQAWLVEYTPDYQVVRKWILYGCWISELSEGPYNQENNDKNQITATIQVDRAMIDTSELE